MLLQQIGAVIQGKNNAIGKDTPAEGLGEIHQVAFSRKYKMIAIEMVGPKKSDGRQTQNKKPNDCPGSLGN